MYVEKYFMIIVIVILLYIKGFIQEKNLIHVMYVEELLMLVKA